MEPHSVIVYDKLVRDRIPDILEAEGKRCEVRSLGLEERRIRLMSMLVEECEEFSAGGDIEELADLVEVVRALISASGMSWESFEKIRLAKRRECGGFDDGILLLIRGER